MNANTPDTPSASAGRPWILSGIALNLFRVGVVHFFLGLLISFVPGSEKPWFIVTSVLVSFGLVGPWRPYRIAAIVFLVLSIIGVMNGHKRGIEYRNRMENYRPVAR